MGARVCVYIHTMYKYKYKYIYIYIYTHTRASIYMLAAPTSEYILNVTGPYMYMSILTCTRTVV